MAKRRSAAAAEVVPAAWPVLPLPADTKVPGSTAEMLVGYAALWPVAFSALLRALLPLRSIQGTTPDSYLDGVFIEVLPQQGEVVLLATDQAACGVLRVEVPLDAAMEGCGLIPWREVEYFAEGGGTFSVQEVKREAVPAWRDVVAMGPAVPGAMSLDAALLALPLQMAKSMGHQGNARGLWFDVRAWRMDRPVVFTARSPFLVDGLSVHLAVVVQPGRF